MNHIPTTSSSVHLTSPSRPQLQVPSNSNPAAPSNPAALRTASTMPYSAPAAANAAIDYLPTPAAFTQYHRTAAPTTTASGPSTTSGYSATTLPTGAAASAGSVMIPLEDVVRQLNTRDRENERLAASSRKLLDDFVHNSRMLQEQADEIASLKHELDEKENAIASLQSDVSQYHGASQDMESRVAAETKTFSETVDTLHQRARDQSAEIVKLQATVAGKDQTILALEKKCQLIEANAAQRIEMARREAEMESDGVLRERSKHNQRIETEYRQLLSEREAKLVAASLDASRHRDEALKSTEKLRDAEKELLERELHIRRITSERDEVQRAKDFEIRTAKDELEVLVKARSEAERAQQMTILGLQKELDRKQHDLDLLTNKNTDHRHLSDQEVRRRDDALQEERRVLHDQERQHAEKLRQAERALAESQDLVDRLKRQLRDEAASRDAAEGERGHLDERILTLQRALGKRDLDVQRLQNQVTSLLKEVSDAEKAADVVKAEFDLRDRIELSKQELELSRRLKRFHESAVHPEHGLAESFAAALQSPTVASNLWPQQHSTLGQQFGPATSSYVLGAVPTHSFYAPAAAELPRPGDNSALPPNASFRANASPARAVPNSFHALAPPNVSIISGPPAPSEAVNALKDQLTLYQAQVTHLQAERERELVRQLDDAKRHAERMKKRHDHTVNDMIHQQQSSLLALSRLSAHPPNGSGELGTAHQQQHDLGTSVLAEEAASRNMEPTLGPALVRRAVPLTSSSSSVPRGTRYDTVTGSAASRWTQDSRQEDGRARPGEVDESTESDAIQRLNAVTQRLTSSAIHNASSAQGHAHPIVAAARDQQQHAPPSGSATPVRGGAHLPRTYVPLPHSSASSTGATAGSR